MGNTVDGIVSGINTTDLITSMLTLEAGPQSLLQSKASRTNAMVSALQALNTKVASLGEAATAASKAEAWNVVKASITQAGAGSSSVGATAVASDKAQPGSVSFRVDSLASAQTSLVTLPASLGDSPTFTISRGGTDITVAAASGALPDIVEAFNGSGTGVRATLLTVDETDDSGKPTGGKVQLLQLTGTETGSNQAFSVAFQGQDGPQAVALNHLTQAGDARITLFPGTSAERTRTSGTNTFADLLTGVDVTVTQATASGAEPLSLSLTRDDAATKKLASSLVDNLNLVLSEIASRTKSTTAQSDDGSDILKPGIFGGDSTVRSLQQELMAQGSGTVGGVGAADVGIVIDRSGNFSFDADAFSKAMAADPEKARSVLMGLASNLSQVAKANSDPIDGVLTASIKTNQDTSADLTSRIKAWDDRLADRKQALVNQFAAMEKALSQLKGQGDYLTNIITSMNSSKSS